MSSPGSMAAGRPITVRQAPVARRHGVSGILPDGVRIFDLAGHGDVRGRLTEIYREDWWPYGAARQWNHVASRAGVMRGVHVHTRAAEYYVLLGGRVVVGYRDVRRGSPTRGRTALVELGAAGPGVIAAPPGLAHGVYAVEAFTLLVGTTTVRDDAAELGCHWKDPDLEIPWPFTTAIVSRRDASLGRLADVLPLAPPFRGDGSQG